MEDNMAVSIEEAREIVEDVFDFDHVGEVMSALRRDLESKAAREDLVNELTRCAVEEADDNSDDSMAVFKSAAEARVEQFIEGSRYSQSGCSKL
jgi:hypothetical protein